MANVTGSCTDEVVMFFKDKAECMEFMRRMGIDTANLEARRSVQHRVPGSVRITFEDSRVAPYVLAKHVAGWLGTYQSCLLWVIEAGIWPARENRHLYYRLRRTYGDHNELHAAPGHYFEHYEAADLITLIDLTIQFGWGGYLICNPNWTTVFISHDGWMRVETSLDWERVVSDVRQLSLPYEFDES